MDPHDHSHHSSEAAGEDNYTPLFLVLAGILVLTALTALFTGYSTPEGIMRMFMGWFFLIFSFFKFLDWKGFAYAFAEYDILAKHSLFYAYVYPVLELKLGILYLAGWAGIPVHLFTVLLMSISA